MQPLPLDHPFPLEALYMGPPLDEGALPAAIYFALSARESLLEPPYNAPAAILSAPRMRLFSYTLPYHDASDPKSKFSAMGRWAEALKAGDPFLDHFLDQLARAVDWLAEQGIIDDEAVGALGLSRGTWVAGQLAARLPLIKRLLGYAPLVDLKAIEEFQTDDDPLFAQKLESLSLFSQVDRLSELKAIRFYIGNRDERVSTDKVYTLSRTLAEEAYQRRTRMQLELNIGPSIGHKGHGTAPHIFQEGALWLREQLSKK